MVFPAARGRITGIHRIRGVGWRPLDGCARSLGSRGTGRLGVLLIRRSIKRNDTRAACRRSRRGIRRLRRRGGCSGRRRCLSRLRRLRTFRARDRARNKHRSRHRATGKRRQNQEASPKEGHRFRERVAFGLNLKRKDWFLGPREDAAAQGRHAPQSACGTSPA